MLSEAEFEALLERLNTDANGKSALRNFRADSAVRAQEPPSPQADEPLSEDETARMSADEMLSRLNMDLEASFRQLHPTDSAQDEFMARMSKEVEARAASRCDACPSPC